MLLSIGQAALAIGVSVSTLRRWGREQRISPTHKTAGGHRRYLLRDLQSIGKSCGSNTERIDLAYVHESSSEQRDDLERQSARLESYCNSKAMTNPSDT